MDDLKMQEHFDKLDIARANIDNWEAMADNAEFVASVGGVTAYQLQLGNLTHKFHELNYSI